MITTVAGNGQSGHSGDGGPATAAGLFLPGGIATDGAGNIYIVETGSILGASNNTVRKVTPDGMISTVKTGPLSSPAGVAVDPFGNLFIADTNNNRVQEVANGGGVTTAAGGGPTGKFLGGFSGDGGFAAAAWLSMPCAIAADPVGNVYVADCGNERIRVISSPGAGSSSAPSIAPGGLTPVYSSSTTIQPGEWVTIRGSGLANTTMSSNGTFPSVLGDTSVTIDGRAAYLIYVSPTQINLQAPDDITDGVVPVAVTNAGGSATSTVTLARTSPSFFLLDSMHVTGVIVRPDGSGAYGGGAYDILGPTGTSLGYPTKAARAGDTIELFATGLGPTTPTTYAGQPFSGAAATNYSVVLVINGHTVLPAFAGLSEAGLYQINVNLPAGLGAGDVSLMAYTDATATQSGVVISLQ